MRSFRAYIFLIIAVLFLGMACKKENTSFPEVNILSLNQGGSYEFGDTIRVTASVVGDDGSVTISLLNGAKAQPWLKVSKEKIEDTFYFQSILNDINLPTSRYTIKVTAFNGENRRSDFVDVQINGLQKALRGFTYLTKPQGGVSNFINRQDSIARTVSLPLTTYNYGKVAANSLTGQLISLPENSGTILGHSFNDMTQEYSSALSPLNSLNYQNLFIHDNEAYVLLEDGRTMSISATGNFSQRFILPGSFLPLEIAFNDDEFLTLANKQGTQLYEIFLIRKANNFVLDRVTLVGIGKSVSYAGGGHYFIVVENNGNVDIIDYNDQTGLTVKVYTLANESAIEIIHCGDYQYLRTSTGVYFFPNTGFQTPQLLFNFAVDFLVYEEVENQVYFGNLANTWQANVASSQNVLFPSLPGGIISLALLYNK